MGPTRATSLFGACSFLCMTMLSGFNGGGSVWAAASLPSQDRYHITTFGAERRARWSLEGKTALVTGGTKVMVSVLTVPYLALERSFVLRSGHAVLYIKYAAGSTFSKAIPVPFLLGSDRNASTT